MSFDTSLWNYFLNAGLVVKVVMLFLVLASIMSWAFIMQRSYFFKDMRSANKKFDNVFTSGIDLSNLYTDTLKRNHHLLGSEAIFQAGYKEYLRLEQQGGVSPQATLDNVQRAMRVVQLKQQEAMERKLPLLATVGSISPYVGLFGTVWGIMLSFRALAHVQQATVSMVAPGIAEALIATAMGLFAAIPAVIAYNRYASEINRLLNQFDAFQDAFINLIFRKSHLPKQVEEY